MSRGGQLRRLALLEVAHADRQRQAEAEKLAAHYAAMSDEEVMRAYLKLNRPIDPEELVQLEAMSQEELEAGIRRLLEAETI